MLLTGDEQYFLRAVAAPKGGSGGGGPSIKDVQRSQANIVEGPMIPKDAGSISVFVIDKVLKSGECICADNVLCLCSYLEQCTHVRHAVSLSPSALLPALPSVTHHLSLTRFPLCVLCFCFSFSLPPPPPLPAT